MSLLHGLNIRDTIILNYHLLPEKEFQMFDQGTKIPLRDLHFSQDLRKLHWKRRVQQSLVPDKLRTRLGKER